MPWIELTQGQRARVDWTDYRKFSCLKWYAHYDPRVKSFYAARSTGGRSSKRNIWMHREILSLESGRVDSRHVDHINHDTLDNRRSNLRAVTHRENHENRRKHSRFGIGVSIDRRCKTRQFRATVRVHGKSVYIGSFATAIEASVARRFFLRSIKE